MAVVILWSCLEDRKRSNCSWK